MARHETDREDLLREATALKERIEYELPVGQRVVVGFRSDGSGSVFFDVEPVYQFNRRGELRRAYLQGLLVKAEAGNLVSLQRRRLEREVQLIRHPWSPEETARRMKEMETKLRSLLQHLQTCDCQIVGQVPEDTSVDSRVQRWLMELLERPLIVAASPRL